MDPGGDRFGPPGKFRFGLVETIDGGRAVGKGGRGPGGEEIGAELGGMGRNRAFRKRQRTRRILDLERHFRRGDQHAEVIGRFGERTVEEFSCPIGLADRPPFAGDLDERLDASRFDAERRLEIGERFPPFAERPMGMARLHQRRPVIGLRREHAGNGFERIYRFSAVAELARKFEPCLDIARVRGDRCPEMSERGVAVAFPPRQPSEGDGETRLLRMTARGLGKMRGRVVEAIGFDEEIAEIDRRGRNVRIVAGEAAKERLRVRGPADSAQLRRDFKLDGHMSGIDGRRCLESGEGGGAVAALAIEMAEFDLRTEMAGGVDERLLEKRFRRLAVVDGAKAPRHFDADGGIGGSKPRRRLKCCERRAVLASGAEHVSAFDMGWRGLGLHVVRVGEDGLGLIQAIQHAEVAGDLHHDVAPLRRSRRRGSECGEGGRPVAFGPPLEGD